MESQARASYSDQCVSCRKATRDRADAEKMMWLFCWLLVVRESRMCRRFQEKRGGCATRRSARSGATRSFRTKSWQRSCHVSSLEKGAEWRSRQSIAGHRICGSPVSKKRRCRAQPQQDQECERLAGRGSARGGDPSASHRRLAPVAESRGAPTHPKSSRRPGAESQRHRFLTQRARLQPRLVVAVE